MDKYVKVPLSDEDARSLKSGDYVYLTGTIYTARDAAHKRMQEALDRGEALPIGMKNNVIYYMGPSPAREGRPIGSAGPTTASRMDKYAPGLLDLGLKGMIGKGKRSQEVRDAIVRNGAVYFAAVGGAGALLSRAITSSEVIAYDDLGTEAIRKLTFAVEQAFLIPPSVNIVTGSESTVPLKSPVIITGSSPAICFIFSSINLALSRRATSPTWSKWVLKAATFLPLTLSFNTAQVTIRSHAASQPFFPMESGVSLSPKSPFFKSSKRSVL